jgi:hypothetical protein
MGGSWATVIAYGCAVVALVGGMDRPASLQDLAFDFPVCECDLTSSLCDLNCCCDPDCTCDDMPRWAMHPAQMTCMGLQSKRVWGRCSTVAATRASKEVHPHLLARAEQRADSVTLLVSLLCFLPFCFDGLFCEALDVWAKVWYGVVGWGDAEPEHMGAALVDYDDSTADD